MYYDPSFRALMNMALPTKFDPSAKFAKGGHNFRKPLLQAIMAESKEESLKHLNAYLAGWYDGNRKIGKPNAPLANISANKHNTTPWAESCSKSTTAAGANTATMPPDN